MEINDDWKPTVNNINNLPRGLRKYIHDLETMCDPAGLVQENAMLRDDRDALLDALQKEQKLTEAKWKEQASILVPPF